MQETTRWPFTIAHRRKRLPADVQARAWKPLKTSLRFHASCACAPLKKKPMSRCVKPQRWPNCAPLPKPPRPPLLQKLKQRPPRPCRRVPNGNNVYNKCPGAIACRAASPSKRLSKRVRRTWPTSVVGQALFPYRRAAQRACYQLYATVPYSVRCCPYWQPKVLKQPATYSLSNRLLAFRDTSTPSSEASTLPN